MISDRERAIFWIVILFLFCLFIRAVSGILLPFVVGILVAYLLNPSADKLEKWGLSRGIATAFIIVGFFSVIGLILIILTPLLYDQVSEFLNKLPDYYEKVRGMLPALGKKYLPFFDYRDLANPKVISKNSSDYVLKFGSSILGSIWLSGLALLNIVSLLIITPVVAFYLLRDWDVIVMKLNNLLPASYAPYVRSQLKEVDRTLSGFLRGQINVCVIMAIIYSAALSLIGLDFGLVLGIICGMLIFIPFVGVIFGITAALIIGLLQFDTLQPFLLMGIVFLTGQSFETYFLTPKLVGEKVGLHPVWVIFGMLSGGAILGITGIILSVPITAIIGVFTRFFIGRYRESDLYRS